MSRFLPPSLAEVQNYCEIKGYQLDPQSFYDYWSQQQWKLDGKAIFNWMQLADKAEETIRAGKPQRQVAVRPAYTDQTATDDEITPDERAALIEDIERLKAEVQRQIDEYKASIRKGQ